jgi:hypothetical protein
VTGRWVAVSAATHRVGSGPRPTEPGLWRCLAQAGHRRTPATGLARPPGTPRTARSAATVDPTRPDDRRILPTDPNQPPIRLCSGIPAIRPRGFQAPGLAASGRLASGFRRPGLGASGHSASASGHPASRLRATRPRGSGPPGLAAPGHPASRPQPPGLSTLGQPVSRFRPPSHPGNRAARASESPAGRYPGHSGLRPQASELGPQTSGLGASQPLVPLGPGHLGLGVPSTGHRAPGNRAGRHPRPGVRRLTPHRAPGTGHRAPGTGHRAPAHFDHPLNPTVRRYLPDLDKEEPL